MGVNNKEIYRINYLRTIKTKNWSGHFYLKLRMGRNLSQTLRANER